MVDYESLYPGAIYTTPFPSYYSPPIASYKASIGELGAAIDPRTANQLGELNIKLNPGVRTIEVQGISAQTFESIPEQHIEEMKRLSKLTGVTPTLHGPLLEPSGIGEGGFTEENRLGVEKQMESAVLRGNRLDPDGNVVITFHSTSQLPELRPHIYKDKEKIEQGVYVINEDTGQIRPIKPEKRYLIEGEKFTGKEIPFNYKNEINRTNREMWTENVSQVNRIADFAEEHFDRARRLIPENAPEELKDLGKIGKIDTSLIEDKKEKRLFENLKRDVESGQIYLKDSYRGIKSLFNTAWNNVKNEEDRKKLKEFAETVSPQISEIRIEKDPEKSEQLKEIVQKGLKLFNSIQPEIFKPLNNFVIEKSAQTFANVAESAYNKYHEKAPIISIENPPASSQGLSTAEDLKELVIESREKLSKNLVEHSGLSKGEASQIAEKMIGATWDVGHINLLRKKGYTEQQIVEETKKIAPFVKHVHLSDNFGLDHTELPMGMGNVPLKPMIEELRKAGFEGKQIIEAGNWWQYFADKGGGNPFLPSIEAFNSPVYSMKEGLTWSQGGIYGSYFSGHGPINPQVHHNIYGSGFQNLPVELGGEIPGGERGRFAGGGGQ